MQYDLERALLEINSVQHREELLQHVSLLFKYLPTQISRCFLFFLFDYNSTLYENNTTPYEPSQLQVMSQSSKKPYLIA